MSKDIRSFFMAGNKKPAKTSEAPVKRRAIVSSDEEIPETPPTKKKDNAAVKKRRVIDSDDESKEIPKKKAERKEKLKPVANIADIYSSQPVKRVEKPKKPILKEEIDIHSDEEFAKTLVSMEESGLLPKPMKKSEDIVSSPHFKNTDKKHTPKKEKSRHDKESPKKNEDKNRDQNGHHEKKKESPKEHVRKKEENKESPTKSEDKVKIATPKRKHEEKESSDHKKKKSPEENLNESVLTDEEKHERKRMAAMLYQSFKSRAKSGPPNPGSKEIPKGKPNCLAGLQFLITGMLESMEREECASVIKDFGGKVVSSVSKKLTYMVVGEDAGPAKLAKADDLKIPQISESDLLDMIRERSGIPKIYDKKKEKKESPRKEEKRIKKEEKSPKKESKSPKKQENRNEFKIPKKERHDDDQKRKKSVENIPEKKLTSEIDIPQFEREVSEYQKGIASTDNMAWVDRYKPSSIKAIIGQSGPNSNCSKLLNWLSKWHKNHDGKKDKKLAKPNPWAKNDDGAYYKAALLSGPPGVGKTTTATLVCKELGLDTVEFNASDTRSKKLLKEQVSELLTNKSLFGYFSGTGEKVSSKHVLLMDEVDGMAGNEDRGGMAELIQLIKDSNVPVICMCNDRNHPKIRSLVNYCYDLRFSKPQLNQIKGAMMSVCFKEGLKLEPGALDEIIAGTGNDVRQVLNHLALYSAGKMNLSTDKVKKQAEIAKKDVKIGPWEVVRKVFSAEDHKTMSINDKSDLFFHDYSMAPLFVQENYLKVNPKCPKSELLDRIAKTADSLSLGDLADKKIRSSMMWSLLPLQAMYSSVLPGEYMEGTFAGQINFPGWLGKNSKSNKRKRLAQEVHDHTRTKTSGSRLSVRLDYAPFLLSAIVKPLKEKGADGVEESLNVIKEYRLLREDIDALIELTTWPKKKGPWDEIDGKVKAALTRAYNKEVQPYSYSVIAAVKKKKTQSVDEEGAGMYGEDGCEDVQEDSEEEKEDDNLENNAFIKVKKKAPAKDKASSSKAKKETKEKAGTSSKGKKK